MATTFSLSNGQRERERERERYWQAIDCKKKKEGRGSFKRIKVPSKARLLDIQTLLLWPTEYLTIWPKAVCRSHNDRGVTT